VETTIESPSVRCRFAAETAKSTAQVVLPTPPLPAKKWKRGRPLMDGSDRADNRVVMNPSKAEPADTQSLPDALEHILRTAAGRGASTVYVCAQSPVLMRVHGDLQALDQAPVFTSDEIEVMVLSLKVAQRADVRRVVASSEWTTDLANVGQVRCSTFKDQRGAGAIFQLAEPRTAGEESGLSLEVEQLAVERDGLVLVCGPRGSGKLRVMQQLAKTVARSRDAYVISVQREAGVSTSDANALISEREARDGLDDMLKVAREALRENPDVLLLHEARSAALMNLALDAAASGQLVLAGFTGSAAAGTLEHLLELYPAAQRPNVQLQLARHLRAIVGQVLVRKANGGRMVAQEVLQVTPAIATLLAEAEFWQLRSLLDASRQHGIVRLTDTLVNLVWTGEVRAEDAYHAAPDRVRLVDKLKRRGIETPFARA
jgi:twitching motility protein PilT